MKTFAVTHTGLVRKNNEDRFIVKEYPDSSVLIGVADGMGGRARGEYAAEMVIQRLSGYEPGPGTEDKQRRLSVLVKEADLFLRAEADKNPKYKGMGTTVTAALIKNNAAYWVHVGDSRMYVLRDQNLIQITRDHNVAQRLLEQGKISYEEARTHFSQNQLLQCVGCGSCEPESGRLLVRPGDLLIFSSDGLNGEVPTDIFSFLLIAETDIETKAKALVQLTLDSGGKDNVTVVVAEI